MGRHSCCFSWLIREALAEANSDEGTMGIGFIPYIFPYIQLFMFSINHVSFFSLGAFYLVFLHSSLYYA